MDTHQRTVESLTTWLGRPQFFYGILVGLTLWMLVNSLAPQFGWKQRDDPREHLELQMSVRTEQRTAKIIDLLEELRRDMPGG